MEKILVVDDDEAIRKLIKDFLEKENFYVDTAKNGFEALEMIMQDRAKYQIAVLDIMLPDISGIEVCKKIRGFSLMPVIMLTAKSEDADKIEGLETGADDYLTKPFNPSELVARIKAITRRSYTKIIKIQPHTTIEKQEPEIITIKFKKTQSLKNKVIEKLVNPKDKLQDTVIKLEINTRARKIFVNDSEVKLTNKEFNLLNYLAENRNTVISREQILEKIWDFDFVGESRTIDVHIKQLRKKIGDSQGNLIETIWAVGYRFNADY